MQDSRYIPNEHALELVKKASFFLVLFLCVFIPVRSVLELYTHSLIKIIPDLLVIALFFWYAVVIRFRFQFYVHDWIILGFLLAAFVSSIFINKTGLIPYIFQVRSMGIYYILYFVLRNLDYGKKEFVITVNVLHIMSLLLLAFSIIEKVCSKTILFPQSIADGIIFATNFARTYSLFFNPNTYAVFTVFIIFMSIARRIVYGVKTSPIMFGCLFMALLLSMSRSGFIIFFVGLFVITLFLVIKYKKSFPYKKWGISLIVAVVIGYGGYYAARWGTYEYHSLILQNSDKDNETITDSIGMGVGDRIEETVSPGEIDNSSQSGRLYSVTKGFEIFHDYPILGTGFGTFGSAASMNFKPALADKYDLPFPFYSDMQYMTILVETGIIGSVLFLLFLGFILYKYHKSFILIFFCILFGWFGLFYNIFEVQIASVLFWVFLSLSDFKLPNKWISLNMEVSQNAE